MLVLRFVQNDEYSNLVVRRQATKMEACHTNSASSDLHHEAQINSLKVWLTLSMVLVRDWDTAAGVPMTFSP